MKIFIALIVLLSAAGGQEEIIPRIKILPPLDLKSYILGNLNLEVKEVDGDSVYLEYTCDNKGNLLDFFATAKDGDNFLKWQAINDNNKLAVVKKRWFVKGVENVDFDGSGVLVGVEVFSLDISKLNDERPKIDPTLKLFLQAIKEDFTKRNPKN